MRLFGSAPATQAQARPPYQPVEPELQENMIRQVSRPATFTSDVLVPLVQAGITGGLGAYLSYKLWGWDPLTLFLIVTAAVWGLLLIDVRKLIGTAERLTHLDLNKDGRLGNARYPVPIINNRPGPRHVDPRSKPVTVLPVDGHPFERFVRGCKHVGTDIRKWETVLGRDTYREWRDSLITAGWAEWCSIGADGKPNAQRGWRLVAEPDEILKHIDIQEQERG